MSRSSTDQACRACLGLGTNLGRRRDNLANAIAALSQVGTVVAGSHVYESDAVGYTDQPRFWNMAVAVRTALSPADLLDAVKRIEVELGRTTTFAQGPRVIDIDLLLHDDAVVTTAALQVPHPRMLERAFVLRPLLDLDTDQRDPASGRRLDDVLAGLDDSGLVRVADAATMLDPRNEGV